MCDKEKTALEKRAQVVRVIYTIINLCILSFIILLCVYVDIRPVSLAVKIVANLIMIGTLISPIPLWFLNRPCHVIHTKPQQIYLNVSRVFLVLAWVCFFWLYLLFFEFLIERGFDIVYV